jgi:Thioredoxin-like [2Fe-2S] ferredoxin
MSKQQKFTRSLTGHFLGWGDDRTPHRYLKLATANGEQRFKIAKSLRAQIQDWQPGLWVNLMSQERIDRATGERKIKIQQLLISTADPSSDSPPVLTSSVPPTSAQLIPTKIQVCGGSSCRRRGSEHICQSMQAYLDRYNLTDEVQIETVKCLHQCKAAPHAIVTGATDPGKTHYRQLQPGRVQALLAKHFPIAAPSTPIETNFIEKISSYLQQHQIVTIDPHLSFPAQLLDNPCKI